MDRIGEAAMVHHRIICGDCATFEGDELDIVFLSMIADRNHDPRPPLNPAAFCLKYSDEARCSRGLIIYKKLSHGFYFVIPTTTQKKEGSWFVRVRYQRT
jgi:hypothetical protein